ncbi:MAG: AzlC family ABC transporter permease [Spirochaetes bacterium]|nr:AzlC family ABC transporter permease [Spirochaetota bacterium]
MLNKTDLKNGIYSGIPIFIGYFPIAITFGLLAKSVNISFFESFCFSALVFAGASQFVSINMYHAGIGAGEIILTVFLLNFRHFLMSATISSKSSFKKILIPIISFGITDETFAVAALKEGGISGSYIIGLNFTSYSGWVIGTVIGYIAGDFLPHVIQSSFSICIYALFVAILIPAVRKSFTAGFIAVAAGAANSMLGYFSLFSSGWNIIISILLVSAAGMFIFNEDN